jgi:membrane protein implicated in regulation of membrane protease activity
MERLAGTLIVLAIGYICFMAGLLLLQAGIIVPISSNLLVVIDIIISISLIALWFNARRKQRKNGKPKPPVS